MYPQAGWRRWVDRLGYTNLLLGFGGPRGELGGCVGSHNGARAMNGVIQKSVHLGVPWPGWESCLQRRTYQQNIYLRTFIVRNYKL